MLNTHSKEVFDVGENIFVIYCDNVYQELGFPLIPENKDDADLLRHALDTSKII